MQFHGIKVDLVRPESYALRWDIVTAAPRNPTRGIAAALGACWPSTGPRWPGRSVRRAPTMESARFDALAYGGAVIDDLVAGGVPMMEIARAGAEALALLQDGLFSEREVRAAEDFTVAPGGSTP